MGESNFFPVGVPGAGGWTENGQQRQYGQPPYWPNFPTTSPLFFRPDYTGCIDPQLMVLDNNRGLGQQRGLHRGQSIEPQGDRLLGELGRLNVGHNMMLGPGDGRRSSPLLSSNNLHTLQQTQLPPSKMDISAWVNEDKVPEDRAGVMVVNHSNLDAAPNTQEPRKKPTKSSTSSGRRSKAEIESEDNPHRCEQCPSGFLSKDGLRHHVRNKHATRPYSCMECGQLCLGPKDLRRHELKHNPDAPRERCPLPGCKGMEKGFSRKDHFVRHMRSKKHKERMRLFEMEQFDGEKVGSLHNQVWTRSAM